MVLPSNAPTSEEADARVRALDAAEGLFYERGVRAVGMDDVRDRAGVPLKRLYGLFGSKEDLVVAMLRRRDVRWRGRVTAHVRTHADPDERLLAVFDWLLEWFGEAGYRGCAWINIFGELGATSDAVVDEARAHKAAFARDIGVLVAEAGRPAALADQLVLLAEGAMVTSAITGTPAPATTARQAAAALLAAGGPAP
ncbi:TetR/AcrR family transcriptional regulator [Patulibacter sp. NPDC049589]|uniref:TetR/AcrR family transcriptional regulator n=1 Tax=Patulibacter sp. NPDC049589 TaxID=3154731 RepID=UPI0034129A82